MTIQVVEGCGNIASGGTPFDGETCKLERGHAGWHESGGCNWGIGEYPVPEGHEVLTGEAMEAALFPGTPYMGRLTSELDAAEQRGRAKALEGMFSILATMDVGLHDAAATGSTFCGSRCPRCALDALRSLGSTGGGQ